MTVITMDIAKSHLQAWLDAEYAVAVGGQSYTIGSRTLTRANLAEIRDSINFWQGKVNALAAGGGIRLRRARPLDC